MPESTYIPVHIHDNLLEGIIVAARYHINKVLQSYEDAKHVCFEMKRVLTMFPVSQCVGSILHTIKTHKEPGNMTARIIHNCTASPLSGIGKWVNNILFAAMKHHKHIVKSSSQLINLVRDVRIDSEVILLKLDIKNFYMDAPHEGLIEHTVSALDSDSTFSHAQRSTFKGILQFLLTNQYVRHRGATYRVIKGSGMGFVSSSAISGSAFYNLVEKGFVDSPAVRVANGIVAYARYEDDVFAILKWGRHEQFLAEMKRRASSLWQVILESSSPSHAVVLDIYFYLDGSRVVYRPYTKPTSCHVPLHASSSHPWTIHKMWPVTEVQRIFHRSECLHDFRFFRSILVEKFTRFLFPDNIVQSCRDWSPPLIKINKPALQHKTLRFVVSYHPLLSSCLLGEVINDCAAVWASTLKIVNWELPRFQVSWCNELRPLHLVLRARRF
jgi:hypothetical protein